MSRELYRELKLGGKEVIISGVQIRSLTKDINNKILMSSGDTVPTDGSDGFAIGGMFIHSNGIDGQNQYINEGSASSSDFNRIITEVVQSVTPNSGSEAASVILAGAKAVDVAAVTNDADDFIVLPSLSSIEIGHTIKIACNAGGNFELRTPAASGELINNVDSDGTQEYLCTDENTVIIWKLSDADGWIAQSITALGAVSTAVVPD